MPALVFSTNLGFLKRKNVVGTIFFPCVLESRRNGVTIISNWTCQTRLIRGQKKPILLMIRPNVRKGTGIAGKEDRFLRLRRGDEGQRSCSLITFVQCWRFASQKTTNLMIRNTAHLYKMGGCKYVIDISIIYNIYTTKYIRMSRQRKSDPIEPRTRSRQL
jgi:hypothetical protein